MRQSPLKALLALVFLPLVGCAPFLPPVVPQVAILPAPPNGINQWIARITESTGLTNSHLLPVQGDTKTRRMAQPDGSTLTVRIHYQTSGSSSLLSPLTELEKILALGGSVMAGNPGGSPLVPQPDIMNLVSLTQQIMTFQTNGFGSALNSHIRDLLDAQLAGLAAKPGSSQNITNSLDALLAAYLKAYLDGTYVDRWGNSISQPDLTKLGNDSAGPFSTVLMEALLDYSLMTPIVYDPSQAQSPSNKTPTFVVVFPQLHECVSTNSDTNGVTKAELRAIQYLSGLSGEGAKHLSALAINTFRENATMSQILSTVFQEVARRSAEELSYDFFQRFQYTDAGAGGQAPNYAPNQNANDTNVFQMAPVEQKAVADLLANQDALQSLLKPAPSSPGGQKRTN